MTGISREEAVMVLYRLFQNERGIVQGRSVTDREGKQWKIVRDGSIHAERKHGNRQMYAGCEYQVELVSPKLTYGEMEKLQEVVRHLRKTGAFVNGSCGIHVHVDGSAHTPKSLKNVLTTMYSKEDLLFKALGVQDTRSNYCKKVRPQILEKIRRIPNRDMTMEEFRRLWYGDTRQGEVHTHYDDTRYHALNLHAIFDKGTLEFRCFNSTLHAGKVRAYVTFALAVSALALNQKCTQMRKTAVTENPCFTFRTFLLRLGLIGPEYKNVRRHLLENLEGDKAWRYDKSTYAC